jgi:hypothetical protein
MGQNNKLNNGFIYYILKLALRQMQENLFEHDFFCVSLLIENQGTVQTVLGNYFLTIAN